MMIVVVQNTIQNTNIIIVALTPYNFEATQNVCSDNNNMYSTSIAASNG